MENAWTDYIENVWPKHIENAETEHIENAWTEHKENVWSKHTISLNKTLIKCLDRTHRQSFFSCGLILQRGKL